MTISGPVGPGGVTSPSSSVLMGCCVSDEVTVVGILPGMEVVSVCVVMVDWRRSVVAVADGGADATVDVVAPVVISTPVPVAGGADLDVDVEATVEMVVEELDEGCDVVEERAVPGVRVVVEERVVPGPKMVDCDV